MYKTMFLNKPKLNQMLCFAEKQCFMITNIYAVMLIAYIQALRLWRQTLKRIKGLSKVM